MALRWFKASIHYFKALDKLQIAIFNCYLREDYLENNHFYEQQIHKARLTLLYAMKKIRSIAIQGSQDKLARLENLYEIIFSLNTLKLRISDPATFEICAAEFEDISRRLTDSLKHIILLLDNISEPKSVSIGETAKIMGRLSNKIDVLEEFYRSTLQVVSPDPIFFLFFVQDLMAFRDELEAFLVGVLND